MLSVEAGDSRKPDRTEAVHGKKILAAIATVVAILVGFGAWYYT